MTKRIISLFLVCILAIPIFAVPILAVPAYATNVTTSDDTEYHNTVVTWLHDIYYMLYDIWHEKDGVGGIFAYCQITYNKVLAIFEHLDKWNTDIFDGFWAKMAAWLLIFWNGSDALEVPGLLPTINQGFSTVSGVLGTLDATVNKLVSGIQGQLNSIMNLFLTPIRNSVSYISDQFEELLDLIRGDTSQSDDFKDKTDDIASGMEDMPDVTYPDFEQVDTNIDNLLPQNPTGTIASFFGYFFDGQTYLYFVWTLVFTFSLMSFVLFGKR